MTSRVGSVIVEVVSQHPEKTPNGDNNPFQTDPIDTAALMARIEVCILRSDTAAKESVRAREASDEALRLVIDTKRAVLRIASDHFEIRTGIPPGWKRRLLLAAVASGVGAGTGALVLVGLRGIF